ncbi:hypothetical protein [Microbacterium rhizophilus]|uniref:hypothetical protein n=1 Tax=Microbacterium rhizophilus TaxID=3138934 RepID=UPI0031F17F88
MDADTRAELRLLRARAFGPAADIDRDPAALRRLRELEGLSTLRPAPPLPDDDAPPSDPAPEAPLPQEPLAAIAPTPADPPPPASPPPLSRRLRVTWAATVVAAAALAGGAAYGLTVISPVAVSSGAPQIATLDPSSALEVPSGWFGAGPSSAVYEFHGLILFETTGGFGTSGGTDCFAAVAAEDLPEPDADTTSWSVSGNMYAGCRVGAFPAIVSMIADSGAPEELRARYPGDALQFVRDGDRIGVFLDAD